MKYQNSTPISRNLHKLGIKPQVVDFWIRQFWSKFSVERVFARVIAIEKASQSAVTITLSPNFNFKNFEPGQHVTVTVRINGRSVSRTYSPTLHKNLLKITVKKTSPDGLMSRYLNHELKVGDLIELSQPYGDITWNKLPKTSQYIFCAGGVGITPLLSLLHDHQNIINKKIDLHYWNHTHSDICFQKELLEIQAQYPLVKVHFYTTRENHTENNRIHDSLFSSIKSNSDTVTFLACGPVSFIQAVEKIATNYKGHFLSESQTQFTKPSQNIQNYELNWNGHKLSISNQVTILEALEENGFHPKHGCRMGICKSCTCLKSTGQVENLKDHQISIQNDDEIQICVSRINSNTHLMSGN